MVVFGPCLIAGYGIAEALFSFTGEPAPLWSHFISGPLGIIVLTFIMKILSILFNRWTKSKSHLECHRYGMESTLNMRLLGFDLDQIAALIEDMIPKQTASIA